MISVIHLNIGSNSGDSRAFIARAVAALRSALGGTITVSAEVESEPWGFESANRFINVAVAASVDIEHGWTAGELEGLLAEVKSVERSISAMPHRRPDGSYADREVDIDIIAVDDVVYSSSYLTIPHAHMAERRFVLEPMAAIAPGWRHPLTGLSCREMLDRL